jgi:tetraacyldisaccharide 4'-kinase
MIIRDQRPWPERLLSRLDARPEGALARGLALPAGLWAAGAAACRVLRPALPLPTGIPSLGIGNLRIGGSGKTPVVEDLGRRLQDEGHRVAVLTRGYRAGAGGDEPVWLGDSGLEVFADPDRRAGWERARAAGADRVLLDDALQTRHRPQWILAIVLDRDLDHPPRPLPAGPAREGLPALERADAILVRRELDFEHELPDGALGFRLLPRDFLDPTGMPVPNPKGAGVLFSGLARPESFERDCRGIGIDLRASWRESDHWAPGPQDARRLTGFARSHHAEWILVPEKNLRRFAGLDLPLPVFALRSRIHWDAGVNPLSWLRTRGIAV